MSPVAQEFHISITNLGTQDKYLVRTERVAPGVPLAEEQVIWPVDDWLAKAQQLMNDPLLSLLHDRPLDLMPLSANQSSLNLIALGQELYNALFYGSLRDSWNRAQGIAENRQMVLRLRLGLKSPRLAGLPWEVLHPGDRPLATGTDVAFSRYQVVTGLSNSKLLHSHPVKPLKILMVISTPTDQESLALKQEAEQLQAELSRQGANNSQAIQLTILEQPGREQLTEALEIGHYQIFHYAGHSNQGTAGGALYLVSNKTGLSETLSGDDLAGLLVNNGVQMAVFNSCFGAYTASAAASNNAQEQNLTSSLVKRGIPAVLAMAEQIPDEVALTLTRLFYRNINQGYPIDLSLSRARQGLISAYGSNNLYWALPVLYCHPEFNGFLNTCADETELAQRLILPDPTESFDLEPETEAAPVFEPVHTFAGLINLNYAKNGHISSPALKYEENEPGWRDFDDLGSDDPSYAQDYADVAEMFRQLGKEEPSVSTHNSAGVDSEAVEPNAVVAIEKPEFENDRPEKAKISEIPASRRRVSKSLQGFKLYQWLLNHKIVVAIAASIISLIGIGYFRSLTPQPRDLLPDLNSSTNIENNQAVNLNNANTSTLTALALEQFNRRDLASGIAAVGELLNRGALAQATTALAAVPQETIESPDISFLRGRLAWQSIQAGSKDYSWDDVRRYWELAVKRRPDSVMYNNALGFAYYTEGNYQRAKEAWIRVADLSEKNATAASKPLNSQDSLTAYAGLALLIKQSAENQSAEDRAKLLDKAMKLRQKVIIDDPINFQPDALSKNWMWSEKAIQDWRSLLQI